MVGDAIGRADYEIRNGERRMTKRGTEKPACKVAEELHASHDASVEMQMPC